MARAFVYMIKQDYQNKENEATMNAAGRPEQRRNQSEVRPQTQESCGHIGQSVGNH